jgi:dihydroneopterin aldolase
MQSTSTISIRRQRVRCHIGVPDAERKLSQTLEISVTFPIPACENLAPTDDIAGSINYYDVSVLIDQVAAERPRKLIETLASDLADRITEKFPIPEIDIEIRKYILPETEAVILNYRKKG